MWSPIHSPVIAGMIGEIDYLSVAKIVTIDFENIQLVRLPQTVGYSGKEHSISTICPAGFT